MSENKVEGFSTISEMVENYQPTMVDVRKELMESDLKEICENTPNVRIPELYQYYLNRNKCADCIGINNCEQPIVGLEPYLDDNNRVKYIECKYRKEKNRQNERDNLLEIIEIPRKLLRARMDKFFLSTEERKSAFDYAKKFVENYNPDIFMKGMYIHGYFGTGKTYLLAAIANEMADRGYNCLLAYFPDLVRQLQGLMYDSKLLESKINSLKTIDFLFIDDLGSENMSAWFRDQIFGPILQYRLLEEKPTFFSSNLSLAKNQLPLHLGETKGEVDMTKGPRITERITRSCIVFEITEKDSKLL